MNVNFILTGSTFYPQYRRALISARVHRAPIILWYTGEKPNADVECRKLEVPTWLENQPANVIYSYSAYQIARRYGGLYLGLDTLSIRPAFDLLGDKEIVVSTDVPDDNTTCVHRWNDNFVCQPSSQVMWEICETAKQKILNGRLGWGDIGPIHLSRFVQNYPDKVAGAPFPALCGFEGSTIWKFYLGIEPPPVGTRVLHLFASAYKELFYDGDIAAWARKYPDFAQYAKSDKVDPMIFQPYI